MAYHDILVLDSSSSSSWGLQSPAEENRVSDESIRLAQTRYNLDEIKRITSSFLCHVLAVACPGLAMASHHPPEGFTTFNMAMLLAGLGIPLHHFF